MQGKIICYGDSNTWGYDPRGYFGGRFDAPWPLLLAENTGWDVRNQGENGREIPVFSVKFPENVELLIVMLGTNELLQGENAEAAARKMERFLKNSGLDPSKILLICPPPMQLGAWVFDASLTAASKELAVRYEALSRELGTLFADAGKWGIGLCFDGVHFTQEGHREFAERLCEILKTLNNS